jgi:hypothetical protein
LVSFNWTYPAGALWGVYLIAFFGIFVWHLRRLRASKKILQATPEALPR